MKKICAILACYNPDVFLIEQVESIQAQENVIVDILVFDDNSSIGLDVLSEIGLKNQVQVVKNLSGSGSAGKNFLRSVLAVDASAYDFFCFSDQDDIWFPNKLSAAIDEMDKYSCDGYSSNLLIYENGSVTGLLDKSTKPQTAYDYQFQGGSAGNTYVIRANLMQTLQSALRCYNFLDHVGTVSHDWIIYAIARSYQYRWHFDKSAYIYYRQHANNVYGARKNIWQRVRMLTGNWYSNGVWIVSQYTTGPAPAIDLGASFLGKLKKIPSVFKFRRNKVESAICYLFWLFLYKSR